MLRSLFGVFMVWVIAVIVMVYFNGGVTGQRQIEEVAALMIALVVGLYEMVPWRSILISIGIVFWLYASYMRAHILGSKLDELGAKLDRLEGKLDRLEERLDDKLDDKSRWTPQSDRTKKYAQR
jgi:hypothetical protein